MSTIKRIPFQNTFRPDFGFDLVQLEGLLDREMDHDITAYHRIDFFNIFLPTAGKGVHAIDFTEHAYQVGSLLTIRKGQVQRFAKTAGVKGYLLLFTEEFLASHFGEAEVHRAFHLFNEFLATPTIELHAQEHEEVLQLVKGIEAEYHTYQDSFSASIIRSAVHMIVVKLFRIKARSTERLHQRKYLPEFLQFQQLIEENCFKTRQVQDYARLMHCSTKTLNNIVQEIASASAKTLIDDIFILQVKRLLLNTSLTITEVAYESGFQEPTNFYKYFRKHVGTSPEAFRTDFL